MAALQRFACLIAVSAAGCGAAELEPPPAPSGTTEAVSGTRLQARFLDGGGGARIFWGWFDTDLGVPCAFRAAEDGVLRCLPSGPAAANVFSDAACVKPAVVAEDCSDARYASAAAIATPVCDDPTGTPVHGIGEPISGATYWLDTGDACAELELVAGTTLLTLGDRAAPASFVGGELLREAVDERLARLVLVATDGARLPWGAWDVLRDARCSPDFSGEGLCGPAEIALYYDWLWSGPACEVRACADLSQDLPCAQPTAVANVVEPASPCQPFTWEVAEIGAPVPADNVYSTSGGQVCAKLENPLDNHFYEIGASVDPASLPRLTRSRTGSGRLVVDVDASEGGARVGALPTGFFDTELGVTCYPLRFDDTTIRCVPPDMVGAQVFADPACSTPLAVAPAPSECPANGPIVVFTDGSPNDSIYACGIVTGATMLATTPFRGAAYQLVDAACVSVDPPGDYLELTAVELPILAEVAE